MSASNRSVTRLLLASVAVGALIGATILVAGAAGVVIDVATLALCAAARRPKPRSPLPNTEVRVPAMNQVTS